MVERVVHSIKQEAIEELDRINIRFPHWNKRRPYQEKWASRYRNKLISTGLTLFEADKIVRTLK